MWKTIRRAMLSLGGVLVLTLTGALDGAAAGDGVPDSGGTPLHQATEPGGVRTVVRDGVELTVDASGRLQPPTPAQARLLAAALQHRLAAAAEVRQRDAGETVMQTSVADDRHLNYTRATLRPDGDLTVDCVDATGAGEGLGPAAGLEEE